jgi:hypothetical protein
MQFRYTGREISGPSRRQVGVLPPRVHAQAGAGVGYVLLSVHRLDGVGVLRCNPLLCPFRTLTRKKMSGSARRTLAVPVVVVVAV